MRPGRGVLRTGEVEEVGALCVVQLERAGKGLQDGFGDAAGVAAIEAGVVVDGDPGEQRDFLPAKSRDAPGATP